MDHNDHRKDTELGAAAFELNALLEDATRENLVGKVLKDGKERGEVIYSLYVLSRMVFADIGGMGMLLMLICVIG